MFDNLYLQINNDVDDRIPITFIEENMTIEELTSNFESTLTINVEPNSNYDTIQNYLLQYCNSNSITSINVYNGNNEVVFTTSKYNKVKALYVRASIEENFNTLFSIVFKNQFDIQ